MSRSPTEPCLQCEVLHHAKGKTRSHHMKMGTAEGCSRRPQASSHSILWAPVTHPIPTEGKGLGNAVGSPTPLFSSRADLALQDRPLPSKICHSLTQVTSPGARRHHQAQGISRRGAGRSAGGSLTPMGAEQLCPSICSTSSQSSTGPLRCISERQR